MSASGSGQVPGDVNSTDDGDDCYSPFDSSDYTIVAALSSATSAISFLACLFMIAVIIIYKKYLFFTQRLILYLALAAIISAFFTMLHIVQRVSPNWVCVSTAYLDQTASWSVLIAVVCITINLALVVLFHRNTERFEIAYVLFIFVFPLSYSWIPFINEAYGRAGAWCWIRSEDDNCHNWTYGSVLQLILWYLPLYVLFAIIMVVYIIILVKLRRDRRRWTGNFDPTAKKTEKMIQKEVRPLLWFPFIYLLLYLIPLINRIQDAATDEPVLALWILTALLFPLQGGFVTLAFTLDPDTFKRLRWSEFRAAVTRMWKKDIREYPLTPVQSDSISWKSRTGESTASARNEASVSESQQDLLRKASDDSTSPDISKS